MVTFSREFELCAETLQACEAAQQGGADRIELCSALSEGGITPSRGLLRLALATCSLPVHVLVRPRGGNFLYSDREFRAMCADVEDAAGSGASGVVVGVLSAGGEIDRRRTAELVERAKGLLVTFHRAFDRVPDPGAALEQLIELGCNRLLTSGGKPTAMEGREALAALARQAAGRMRIAAGGGITLANARSLLGIQGLDLHASLRSRTPPSASADPLWSGDSTSEAIPAGAVLAMARLVHL